MKILLVDDDKQAASYLVKGLRESGHTVDHASDGQHGLHLASVRVNLNTSPNVTAMLRQLSFTLSSRYL